MRHVILLSALFWSLATLRVNASGSQPSLTATTGLTLASAGSSPYAIVIPPDALPGQQAAAAELQAYLRKISGAELPILESPPAGSPSIFIGQSEWTRQRGIHLEALGPESFIIRVVGDDLLLGGRDTPGDPWGWYPATSANTPSLFAVYTLLERFMDVRWYWPGELGEEVPARAVVTLPRSLDVEESPDFEERFVSVHPFTADQARWLRRMRLGSSLKLQHQHNWSRILPEKTWLKTQPEYFALVNGIRGSRGGPEGFRHEVCTTNPDVVSIFATEADRYFEEKPQAISFSLSPNDAGGHCECDRCTALDPTTGPDGAPVLTNRIFRFMNAVASRVGMRHPDRFLTTYAYGEYTDASMQLSLEPNLYVLDTYNFASTFLWDPDYRARSYKNMALWRAITPNMSFLTYYYFSPFIRFSLPQVSTGLLPGLFRQLKALNTRGVFFGIDGTSASFGHDVYLIAHLAWDSHSNADKVLEDYYTGLFGPDAGPLVRRYHALIQDAQRRLAPTLGNGRGRVPVEKAYELFRPLRAEVESLLTHASGLTHTQKQRERLAIIRRSWEFITLSLDALTALKNADAAIRANPDQPERTPLLNAVAAIDKRRSYLEQEKEEEILSFKGPSILKGDKAMCTPFLLYRLQYHLDGQRYAATVRSITADRPGPEEWRSAAGFTPFVIPCTGESARVQTEVKALYNDRALFIQFVALEPSPDALTADAITERDGPLWTENVLGVFLDPGKSRRKYYHLLTNQLGTRFDQRLDGKPDRGWNSDWKVQAERGEAQWTAIFEIPFASLETTRPGAGTVWGLNLERQRFAESIENSAWAPTFGGLFRPLYFGTLTFE